MERIGLIAVVILALVSLLVMLSLAGGKETLDPAPVPDDDGPSIGPGLEVTAPPPTRRAPHAPDPEALETSSPDGSTQPLKAPSVRTRGVVVDADGEPITGAVVHYRTRFPSSGFETAQVDAEGRFELPWESQGTSLIVMAAASGTSFPLETVDVHALVSAGAQDVRLVAERGEVLHVEVTGFEDGHPHPDTPVQIVSLGRETRLRLATTLGADGRVSFSGLHEDGGDFVVHVGPAEYARCARGVWRDGGGTLRLELGPAAQVRGRVMGRKDDYVWVTVIDALGFRFGSDREEDGTFTVDGISPGVASCTARANIVAHFLETPWVRCRPGDHDVELAFETEAQSPK